MTKFFFSFLVLLMAFSGQTQTEELLLSELPLPNGGTELYAQNAGFCPLTLSISLKSQMNIQADKSLPCQMLIPAGNEPVKVLTLSPQNPRKDSRYEYEFTYVVGDINARHNDQQAYLLPYENGQSFTVGQGYDGKFSHKGLYCLDFNMPVGTKVCAARSGVVVSVKEDSDTGCNSSRCKNLGNYIVIYHDDGTLANYLHLQYNGALVKPGQKVKAGELIGLSGNTGWSSGPHLHFEVFVQALDHTQSIPTKFLTGSKQIMALKEMETYTSFRPE